jgi:predicted nucleotidyltransferase
MKWLEEERGVVPTDFTILVNELALRPGLKEDINRLIADKVTFASNRTRRITAVPNSDPAA